MSSWIDRKLSFSLNKLLINKNNSGEPFAFRAFEPASANIEEVAQHIQAGYAYSAAMSGPRKNRNFAGSDLVSIDVDYGMSLDEAREHPLVKESATLIYTTCSHTEDENRFRIVFVLQETIKDPEKFHKLTSILGQKLGGDSKATDAARIFYGNTSALIYRLSNGLTSARMMELLAEENDDEGSELSPAVGAYKTARSKTRIPLHQLIKTKSGKELPLSVIEDGTPVHCPFHEDSRPSAVVYRSRKGRLIHCFACSETFWPDIADQSYVFDEFEIAAIESARRNDLKLRLGEAEWRLSSLSLISETFLPKQSLGEGVTFVKSAKGTGKTQLISGFIRDAAPTIRVLVVGHRVTLVRAMCARLGLNCYLDDKNHRGQHGWFDRYGVCLDSLYKLRTPPRYDLVILDESEQVLSHFSSDTMKEKRHKNLICLAAILRDAGKIIALDADLSTFSFETVLRLAETEIERDRHVLINEFRPGQGRAIEIFSSKNQLAADLVRAIRGGQRCYVVSNAKKIVDQLSSAISAQCPTTSLLTVTSDTSDIANDPAVSFIRDPVAQSEHYQLVLSSPTLSSGVDLSFPNGQQFYDAVYGFFEPGVNNHFDCDQQFARVRNPGVAKVFISPMQMFLEHDPIVVKRDLIESPMFGHLHGIDGYDEDLAKNDRLLDLLVEVEARRRASINRLKNNYVEYKRRLGFSISYAAKSEELRDEGKQHFAHGKMDTQQKRMSRLLGAPKMPTTQLRALVEKQARGTPLTKDEKTALDRARFENFYRCDIFADLIELDERVKLADKVRMFEALSRTYSGRPSTVAQSLIPSFKMRMFFLKEAFEAARILGQNGFEGQTIISENELAEFRQFMVNNRAVYEAQFKKTIRNDLDHAAAKQLGDLLAHCYLKTQSAGTKSTAGRKTYLYMLSETRLDGLSKLTRVRLKRETSWPEIDGPDL
ncbi:plasmid replication protein, CyRepA1 family [Rhizobium leguminosarum]|uniref:plasmid replication protein, CyRepA1 family n=1 Tax=Rhizobium leguminosarum TaxID=384 RepID=UPI0003A2D0E1|nr:plasmid replication protein, CyRepA1 family [Rhizobium leguminosarum]